VTTFLPYIAIGVVAIVLLVVMRVQLRNAVKSADRLEERLSELERKLSGIEDAYRNEIRRSGEEKDLKITQLREDLKTALDSVVKTTGNKLVEQATLQQSRLDQLSERVAALGSQVVRAQEPKTSSSQTQTQARPTRQSPAHDKAKRLARLIVSDIVLYNQAAVDEGVRNNTFSELLAHDIREARNLYAQRIPEEIRTGTSYLEEAFAELIARKKRELNVG